MLAFELIVLILNFLIWIIIKEQFKSQSKCFLPFLGKQISFLDVENKNEKKIMTAPLLRIVEFKKGLQQTPLVKT